MKKRRVWLLLAVLIVWPLSGSAQGIRITKFVRDYTGLEPRMNPVNDNAGEACALINCWVPDKGFVIEGNLGVVKREETFDHIKLWVPQGTKRLTVRREGCMPLKGYSIPIPIETKVAYDAYIEIGTSDNKETQQHPVYIGVGYNIMSIQGPTAVLGVDIKNHVVELGAVYGLDKTDRLYFYDKSNNLKASYEYQAVRAQLRYGYDIMAAPFLGIMPQVGAAMNIYSGKDNETKTEDFEKASSVSVIGALRFSLSLGSRVKIQVTPEYDFGAYKSKNCKLISDNDQTFRGWTEGFNLNVGMMFYF